MLCLLLALPPALPASIIGTNPPALPLTVARIAGLPKPQQRPWRDYLARSLRQLQADQAFLQTELKAHKVKQTLIPPSGSSARSMPLTRPPDWYAREPASHVADIIVSFQTPAGGWSKNLDFSQHLRAPGERFAHDNGSHYLGTFDNDLPRDANWSYIGTFDNDATTTQLRFLAKVISASSPESGSKSRAAWRSAFLRGLDYILAAQYPNGGWPQVWPLEGGYHDAITYNDGAMLNILELLQDIASATNEFSFVPAQARTRASKSFHRGLACILATQIVAQGRRTVWCQQHDPLTLQPASARNYEMPSQCAAESAEILMFLMQLPDPSPDVMAAVDAAARWFEKTRLEDVAFKSTGAEGRKLVPAPGNEPIWSRFYEIGTDRPIFGDRDKTIHDTVDEISKERRNGYAWYKDTPKRALQHYARWSKTHPGNAKSPP